ncbi:hypothetical protein C8A01DRAFT_40490 [Parachaetomium inaequale]|uniref:Uncharacterized protein n=1 Tax=Parachaetomium inaequale TaxID=2588326 RepID=A0AAN6P793_9PEZI|nr:hypothetical protein C8A01DRAFT_40490 [Parachaetomium inaequale]
MAEEALATELGWITTDSQEIADDWESTVPAGYNNANRAFIQAFMARGILTF